MPRRSFAKLDMYLSASTEPLFNALEDWMREACGEIDQYHDLAGFAFGQICGIEFAKADAGTYSYLATLWLADKSAPAGYYHSVLITPRQGGLEELEDFDPARHKVAINELGSFSGSVVFHLTCWAGDAGFPVRLEWRACQVGAAGGRRQGEAGCDRPAQL